MISLLPMLGISAGVRGRSPRGDNRTLLAESMLASAFFSSFSSNGSARYVLTTPTSVQTITARGAPNQRGLYE